MSPAVPPGVAALRGSHDWLDSVAATLSPEQLRQRGYPAQWSIAQVLSHIGSGAEINHLILDAGLSGREPPATEAYQPIWDRWNAKSPDQQAADAIATDAALVAAFEANADSRATFISWSGPTDLDGLAVNRLGEHAVHTWDVAVAVDPTATLRPDAVALLLDRLGELVPLTAKPAGWTGSVGVSTIGPDRRFTLVLGDESSLRPAPEPAAPPGKDPAGMATPGAAAGGAAAGEPTDATLRLPAEALIRLVYGRLDPDHAPPVTTTGVTLDELRAAFPGF